MSILVFLLLYLQIKLWVLLVKYLKYYLNVLREYGHKVAIEKTKSRFANDESMKAYYKQPALPENWADIYKQIQFLKNREKLFNDQNAEFENSL